MGRWQSGLAVAALVAVAGAAWAQDGGPLLSFGISTTLRSDDNLDLDDPSPGGSTVFDTRLRLGFSSVTSADSLTLDLDGVYRLADGPGGSASGIVEPRLGFGYTRTSARSRLSLAAGFVRTDLGLLSSETDPTLVFDPDTGLPLIISTDPGERTTRSASLRFETGIDAPLGLTLTLRHLDRRYENPSKADSRTDGAAARIRLKFSPVLTGGLQLDSSRTVTEGLASAGDTRRQNQAAAFSLDYDIDAATRARAQIGWREVQVDSDSGTTRNDGPTFQLSLDRDLPRGRVGLSYSHQIDSDGSRDALSVSRVVDLPLASLSFRLGFSQGEDGDASVVGSVAYNQEFKRGQLGLSLSRDVGEDEDGGTALATRLSMDWSRELTELTSVQFNLDYARVEEAASDDSEQANLQLALQRQIAQDWTLSAGYRYRNTTKAGTSADSNSVFVTFGRDFSVRP